MAMAESTVASFEAAIRLAMDMAVSSICVVASQGEIRMGSGTALQLDGAPLGKTRRDACMSVIHNPMDVAESPLVGQAS
jgi:hypothetical protein